MFTLLRRGLLTIGMHVLATFFCTHLGHKQKGKIWDLGHSIFPFTYYNLPDLLLGPLLAYAFGIMIWEQTLYSYLIQIFSASQIRSVCVALTIYPTCIPPKIGGKGKTSLQQFFLGGFYDLMFSGHALIFTSLIPVIKSFYLRILIFIGIISTVSSRQHYSADTAVGVIIGYFMFRSEQGLF